MNIYKGNANMGVSGSVKAVKVASDDYSVIDTVFNGMKIDTNKSPTMLHDIFKHINSVEVDIIMGVYFLKYKTLHIASIKGLELELTPGFFIHINKDVFKTYNAILHRMAKGKKFIKCIGGKWTLCEDK